MPSRVVVIIFAILLIVPIVAGNGARETDEVAWVITLGIDKGDQDNLIISYRVAVPVALAGTEAGGGKDKKSNVLITLTAKSLAEGRNLLKSQLSREVSLSQVKTIIVGEKLAKSGMADVMGPLLRFREFRGPMYLMLVRGTAVDLLKANQPELETLASRWVENMFHSSDATAYYLPTHLHDFYVRLKTATGASYIAATAVNPGTNKEDGGGPLAGGDKTKQYQAGELPRAGGNSVDVVGVGVFKADKLVGYLTNEQTRVLAILRNNFRRGFISVDDPLLPKKSVNVAFRNGRKPDINIDISGETPVIHINVMLEGEISSIATGINYESPEYLKILENEMSDIMQTQILNTISLTQSWEADPFDFGYYIRSKFSTHQQLKEYDWNSRYRMAVVDVKVTTAIRRMGLMRKTSTIKGD